MFQATRDAMLLNRLLDQNSDFNFPPGAYAFWQPNTMHFILESWCFLHTDLPYLELERCLEWCKFGAVHLVT